MHLALIGCSLLTRELCDAVARSPHQIDARFLPEALHETGANAMRIRIQEAIDDSARNYDAIILGYALCGNGTHGLVARRLPLVLPRAHDCITLLMGSRAKYRDFFAANPGTCFRSAAWVERAADLDRQLAGIGVGRDLPALIEKYGEKTGRLFYEEMLSRFRKSYRKLVYIRTGLGPDNTLVERARAEAREKRWLFEEMVGTNDLLRRLLAGDWNDDFLVVAPGCRVIASYDDAIITSVQPSK
ncbi:MAG: DUF1638 domain-containing protein [Acidobacteriaceae bacterium]